MLAAVLLIASCGDDGGSRSGKFDVSGKVDHFAGPTPLVARLEAKAKHAEGEVIYRWRFDDGTTSTKQSVTHSFTRAGYYQVILDARDEAGTNDRETFLFGAWPPKQWTDAQNRTVTPEYARRVQEVQKRRTDRRRAELRRRLRQQAREQIQG